MNGEYRQAVRIARPALDGKLRLEPDGEKQLTELLQLFLSHEVATVRTPKELAQRMAAIARLVRSLIEKTFEGEEKTGSLHGLLEAFRTTLIPDLEPAQFADMYSQTIAYGLFAARINEPEAKQFTRKDAVWSLRRVPQD